MGKGPSQESETELPPWYVKYAKKNLAVADKAAQLGYVPYSGPDVAAFAPQQVQGMQGIADMAAAFGGAGAKPTNVAASLMPAQDFGGGMKGYSSFQGYEDELARLKKRSPGLYKAITEFSIDPVTGAPAPAYGKPPKAEEEGGGGGSGVAPQNQYEFDLWNKLMSKGGGN